MLDGIKYYNYPDGEKYLRMFFSALFRRKKNATRFIEKLLDEEGVGISDELECYFASEYTVTDNEYFGNTGVVLYVRTPASDEDLAVIITEKEFYSILLQYSEKNITSSNDISQKIIQKIKSKNY